LGGAGEKASAFHHSTHIGNVIMLQLPGPWTKLRYLT